jgi:hypothetical protein
MGGGGVGKRIDRWKNLEKKNLMTQQGNPYAKLGNPEYKYIEITSLKNEILTLHSIKARVGNM